MTDLKSFFSQKNSEKFKEEYFKQIQDFQQSTQYVIKHNIDKRQNQPQKVVENVRKPRGYSYNLFEKQQVPKSGLDFELISKLQNPYHLINKKNEIKSQQNDQTQQKQFQRLDNLNFQFDNLQDFKNDYQQLQSKYDKKKIIQDLSDEVLSVKEKQDERRSSLNQKIMNTEKQTEKQKKINLDLDLSNFDNFNQNNKTFDQSSQNEKKNIQQKNDQQNQFSNKMEKNDISAVNIQNQNIIDDTKNNILEKLQQIKQNRSNQPQIQSEFNFIDEKINSLKLRKQQTRDSPKQAIPPIIIDQPKKEMKMLDLRILQNKQKNQNEQESIITQEISFNQKKNDNIDIQINNMLDKYEIQSKEIQQADISKNNQKKEDIQSRPKEEIQVQQSPNNNFDFSSFQKKFTQNFLQEEIQIHNTQQKDLLNDFKALKQDQQQDQQFQFDQKNYSMENQSKIEIFQDIRSQISQFRNRKNSQHKEQQKQNQILSPIIQKNQKQDGNNQEVKKPQKYLIETQPQQSSQDIVVQKNTLNRLNLEIEKKENISKKLKDQFYQLVQKKIKQSQFEQLKQAGINYRTKKLFIQKIESFLSNQHQKKLKIIFKLMKNHQKQQLKNPKQEIREQLKELNQKKQPELKQTEIFEEIKKKIPVQEFENQDTLTVLPKQQNNKDLLQESIDQICKKKKNLQVIFQKQERNYNPEIQQHPKQLVKQYRQQNIFEMTASISQRKF